jgi:hypothetical protein
MLSSGETITVAVTFDEFDCETATNDFAHIDVRAKPFLPLQSKRTLKVHGIDGGATENHWLAPAIKDAC